ncbi:pectate lyase, partial [Zymoseptoria tritici IPO323]
SNATGIIKARNASSETAPSATTGSPKTAVAGGGLPASSGTSVLSAVKTIAAGESFDGGMMMYDRGVSCTGQTEGGGKDAVFVLEKGASISNVIIGPRQIEGIHCNGGCSLSNVWWSAVCEDAFTIKKQSASETTKIAGGGAYGATDKVLQHNAAGTLSVSGFTADDFGKLYRSCGNCDDMYERHVILNDIKSSNGKILVGINSNYGDTATLVRSLSDILQCVEYKGNDTGDEPEKISSGPSDACIYSESDIS